MVDDAHGQTTEPAYTISSPYEPEGSDELKIEGLKYLPHPLKITEQALNETGPVTLKTMNFTGIIQTNNSDVP